MNLNFPNNIYSKINKLMLVDKKNYDFMKKN